MWHLLTTSLSFFVFFNWQQTLDRMPCLWASNFWLHQQCCWSLAIFWIFNVCNFIPLMVFVLCESLKGILPVLFSVWLTLLWLILWYRVGKPSMPLGCCQSKFTWSTGMHKHFMKWCECTHCSTKCTHWSHRYHEVCITRTFYQDSTGTRNVTFVQKHPNMTCCEFCFILAFHLKCPFPRSLVWAWWEEFSDPSEPVWVEV